MGNCNEDLPQPTTPFPRLATQALPPALGVPRTHAGPGGEVLGAREATHVGPERRKPDLRCPLAHTRDGIQEDDGLLVCCQPLVHCATDARHGLVQVLQRAQVLGQQEAMMRRHASLSGFLQLVALGAEAPPGSIRERLDIAFASADRLHHRPG